MKSDSFPTVGEMLRFYWPIILIALIPSITSSIMIHMVSQRQVAFGFLALIPFFIIAWLIAIGLGLHIVDRHLEPITLSQLLKLGSSFFGTMFRAGLLLAVVMVAIMIPLSVGFKWLGVEGYELAQVVAALAIIKWNLFLEAVLLRDRGLVFDAWATVKKIKLFKNPWLVGLYVAASAFMFIPYMEMDPFLSVPVSLFSTGMTVIINLWALRSVVIYRIAELGV